MMIEEGKFYKTRDGRKVGPARLHSHTYGYWDLGKEFDACHEANGSYFPGGADISPDDLIAEWTDGPVRTVMRTVTEIVPGNYGIVMVYMVGKSVRTEFNRSDAGPAELKAAAAVLLELAGALE